jgi:membrane protease YdiL (CAAX protease family)
LCNPVDVLETPEKPPITGRIVALFEVLLCSDYPTQLAVGAGLYLLGFHPTTASGALSLRYVVLLSLIDTVLLVGLIVVFLRSHRERVRPVLFGARSWVPEAKLGLPLAVGALVLAVAAIGVVRILAPSLHNLERNPLQDVIRGPRDLFLFGLVVVVAGGIREEIQRAFILHRFDVWLGGPTVGLIVSSVAFGLGHRLQGNDVAIATGMLGFYWGAWYLRRRSSIAPMISHAGFNLIELLQFFAFGR